MERWSFFPRPEGITPERHRICGVMNRMRFAALRATIPIQMLASRSFLWLSGCLLQILGWPSGSRLHRLTFWTLTRKTLPITRACRSLTIAILLAYACEDTPLQKLRRPRCCLFPLDYRLLRTFCAPGERTRPVDRTKTHGDSDSTYG